MSAEIVVLLVLFLGGYGMSFFFSGFETGAYALSVIRFELRKAQGDAGALRLASDFEDMPRVIATVLLGTNVGNYALTASGMAILLASFSERDAQLINTAVLAPFIFVFAEVLPKELFRRHADDFMYRSSSLFSLSSRFVGPLTSVLAGIPEVLRRWRLAPQGGRRVKPSTLERFTIELTRGTEEGILSPTQVTIAKRIMSLQGRTVGDAMVPLAQVQRFPVGLSVSEARSRLLKSGFSRAPVERGGELVGTVWIYDLAFGEVASLESIIKPAPTLSPLTGIDAALMILRRERAPLAIVRGGKGRCIGIVTLKDLASEIVAGLHDL